MSTPAPNITFDLIEHARTQPTAPALIRAGKDVSYRELDTMVWRVAQYLHDEGVRAGQVVALTFQSEFFLALSLLALTRLGATTFTVRKSATAYEIDRWFAAVKPSFMLVDTANSAVNGLRALDFNPTRMNAIKQVKFSMLSERPVAMLAVHAGSGSTGHPKLIPITHEQMRHRLRLRQSSGMLAPADRVYKPSSLEFTSSQTQLLQTLHEGAAYCLNELGTARFEDQLTAYKPNVLSLSVFHAESWLNSAVKPLLPKTLKQIRLGASSVSMPLRQRIREMLCENLWIGYGTNETGLISVARPPTVFNEPGTVGKPLQGVSVSIINGIGEPMPRGQIGDIKVSTPGCISHYLAVPTQEASDQTTCPFLDNTFYPGDVGYLTESGELIHLGRSDWMMIYNGINIYPAEIEMCLSLHAAVRSVVAFPLPSDVSQDVPVCAVEMAEPTVSAKELRAFAMKHLGFKAPREVFIVNHIPRTSTGKVIREELFKLIRQA